MAGVGMCMATGIILWSGMLRALGISIARLARACARKSLRRFISRRRGAMHGVYGAPRMLRYQTKALDAAHGSAHITASAPAMGMAANIKKGVAARGMAW